MLALQPRTFGDCWELRAAQSGGDVQYGSFAVPLGDVVVDVRLGYRRSLDFDSRDCPGQDSAAVRGDTHSIVAVVADGVGQSFFGNLAAEHLCGWLLQTLWESRSDPPKATALEQALHEQERALAAVIEAKSVSHLPDLLRRALEQTRKQGSQSVFTGLVWNLREGRGDLYQVGDVIALVHRRTGEPQKMIAPAGGRWSTAGRSQLSLCRSTVDEIEGFVIKTDGASADWGLTRDPAAVDEPHFAAMASERAAIDDVSAVAMFVVDPRRPLQPVRPIERRPEPPRPAPLAGKPNASAAPPPIAVSSPDRRRFERPAPAVERASRLPALSSRRNLFVVGFAAGIAYACLVAGAWWLVDRLDINVLRWTPAIADRAAEQRQTSRSGATPESPASSASQFSAADVVRTSSVDRPGADSPNALAKPGSIVFSNEPQPRAEFLKRVKREQPNGARNAPGSKANADAVLIEIEWRGLSASHVMFKADATILSEPVTVMTDGGRTSLYAIPKFVARQASPVSVELWRDAELLVTGDILLAPHGTSTLTVARQP